MSSPRDTFDDVRFSELVSEGRISRQSPTGSSRSPPPNAKWAGDDRRRTTRTESAERRCVPDAVRYIEKAEWVADLYEREDRPDEHARDFHYRLVSGEYKRRNGEPYVNNDTCWKRVE